MQAQDVARRISGTITGEVFAQVKTYQVPITNSSRSHYIICHLPLVFLSPTSQKNSFYLPLRSFSFAFIFRSIRPKIQKYLTAIYFIWHSTFQYLQISPVNATISGTVNRKGLTTPLIVGLRVFVICVQGLFMLCCLVLLLVR